jgi:hypothetical protein
MIIPNLLRGWGWGIKIVINVFRTRLKILVKIFTLFASVKLLVFLAICDITLLLTRPSGFQRLSFVA